LSPGDNCFVRRGDDETVGDVINKDDLLFPRFIFPSLPRIVWNVGGPAEGGIF
jgi:hypothetical protein